MTERDKAFQLSGDNFDYLCQFVYDTAGIVLNASKKEMVYRRLTRIIRERKLPSFTAYCNLLKADTEKEQDYFINAITTNLTSFFREQHHFDYMTQDELPKLLGNRLSHDKRLRIWSSASSTGEEPYSIAITVLEAMKSQLSQWDVKILATDIDSNVLAVAKEGTYDERRIEDVPRKFKEKYFTKGIGINESKVKVGKQLQALITFKKLNLLHEWPMKGPFDIIFCRNVIIYFDKKTQQELFARYYEMLAPGGLLILGHSENLGQYQQHFESVGRTIFRKAF
ncbi:MULTISPECIES: protein-glutamate O-methyltransferase CheR [unclassified Colwellia]|jgi:chemotaxis protein methyltransferase CheR|uniref:CheR family methyltransferase n=1 Tax=unclassified Colwellia TaxID=196834 RepID=UPI0015F5CFD4|nr:MULTISPECIES: protein-glutamate O-methyltransferase CheR [unclassified Colwellia]MBA6337111.1 protein-glutamate O-methyltransferase CheR [Colwellia sp. BRX8-7]MBA6349208.1 protein-glutamate O-methyltransferase CheR [Colwellia sp. BRX8-9]MBA6353075.1 protein-glutamate O-methyltransferase CheR [Colwellia sp. BRX9-1]MBA6356145.1 protein-glutamate O-methyltransferase CheR [Colwellia sp. BRX8-3]MBA6359168.1 protein-glutamate O-methyltransferase CheR [Colwellia sp. BRX8-6]